MLSAAHARIAELSVQCERGVALIERLKMRLQRQEREKEAQARREGDLQTQLRVAQQQAAAHQQQLNATPPQPRQPAKSAATERAVRKRHEDRVRFEAELRLLVEEIDVLQARAVDAEARAVAAAEEGRVAQQRAEVAEAACAEAEARAAQAVGTAGEAAQRASSGTVALLKAALAESQRRLQATQKTLEEERTWHRTWQAEQAQLHTLQQPAAVRAVPGSEHALSGPSGTQAETERGGPAGRRGGTPLAASVSPTEADDASATPAGLGRLRASLLSSLRAERSKLERERALLDW